jgi:hypothetical protein
MNFDFAFGELGHLGSWAVGVLGSLALGLMGSRAHVFSAHGLSGSWALGLMGSRAHGLSFCLGLNWALGHLGLLLCFRAGKKTEMDETEF